MTHDSIVIIMSPGEAIDQVVHHAGKAVGTQVATKTAQSDDEKVDQQKRPNLGLCCRIWRWITGEKVKK